MNLPDRPIAAEWLVRALGATRDYALMLVSADGKIVDWRGAAEHLFGYTAAEAVGCPFELIFTLEDRARGHDGHEMTLAAATGRSEDDRWHLAKSGLRFWGSGVLQAIRGDDGTLLGYCKILRDRSDVRTRIDALQNRLEALRAQVEANREHLRTVAHELRNALAPLSNAVLLIEKGPSGAAQREWIDILARQVAVLSRLVGDITAAGRGSAGWLRIAPQRIELQQALNVAAAAIRDTIAQRQQTLQVLLPPVPIHLDADPARLQQMLLNLLGNASKYTPANGQIRLSAAIEGPVAIIRVEDNGVGIAEDVLPRIFELFARAPADAEVVEGEGIGLAVVQQIAALHGGGVEARSAGRGKGSGFALRLPLPKDETA